MSDFLKSLAARQLGEAPSVRPRLAGRFEPPPDAFAHEPARRANEFEAHDSGALEHFLEVETHAAPARDTLTPRDTREDSRANEPRRATDETHARVVFAREPREESQPILRQERITARESEQTPDSPSLSGVSDARAQTRERDKDDAHVRPQSVIPASNDESVPVRHDTHTTDRAPFVTRVHARDERREPSSLEARETSVREAVEAKRPSNVIRPAAPPSPARGEATLTPRSHEEESSLIRNESARARERGREDEAASNAARQTQRGRESSNAIEPRHVARRERQATAREAQKERAQVAPTINVTIGRVEVRATQAPAPAPRRAETAAPRMSLDDYLRRRRNGEVRE